MDYRDKVGIFTAALLRNPNIDHAMAITYAHWDIGPLEPDNAAAWGEAKLLADEYRNPCKPKPP